MRRELLERAPGGSYLDRVELFDRFDRPPQLVTAPVTRSVTVNVEYNASSVDKRFFIAPVACKVRKVDLTVTATGTDGSAVTVMVQKVPSGTAIGGGSDVLSATLNLKGTANTIQAGTLHATAGNSALAAGDCLAVDFVGTLTSATGVLTVTLELLEANENWVVSGTNATNDSAVLDVDGGVILTTAGADNDQVIISPRGAVGSLNVNPWSTLELEPEHSAYFESLIYLPSIANVLVQMGLVQSAALDLTTDDDQAKFQFSTEGAVSVANWTAIESIAGTDDEDDTSTAAASATATRLGVLINTSRVPVYYINGTKVHTGDAMTSGVDLIPVLGIQALTASAKSMKLLSVRVSRLLA